MNKVKPLADAVAVVMSILWRRAASVRLRSQPQRARRSVVVVGILLAASLQAQESPPKILQIYRDRLKPGEEATYRKIHEEAARICADLRFPHPHLAIEPLSGPKEVWWLNAFESEGDKQRVTAEFMSNRAVAAALDGISKRTAKVTDDPVNTFANYKPELSRGPKWKLSGARFVVVAVTRGEPKLDGSVFEDPDGTRFILRPTVTRQEADVIATAAGPGTIVFAVRPYWGMPAKEWIAADLEFWKSNPMATAK